MPVFFVSLEQFLSLSSSIHPSINQSINTSINQSVNQWLSQSINPSINQSIDQSVEQSINPSHNQNNTSLDIHNAFHTKYQTKLIFFHIFSTSPRLIHFHFVSLSKKRLSQLHIFNFNSTSKILSQNSLEMPRPSWHFLEFSSTTALNVSHLDLFPILIEKCHPDTDLLQLLLIVTLQTDFWRIFFLQCKWCWTFLTLVQYCIIPLCCVTLAPPP